MNDRTTLPGVDYHDAAIFDLERTNIFHRSWYYVGRADSLTPGDRLVVDIAGESVLIVCDHELNLFAHANVCRHRGAQLCAESGPGPKAPGTVFFSGTEPVPFSEARGAGLAVSEPVAKAKGSVRGDGFFWDEGSSPTLARGPRVGALSDDADPQPASPARSSRLMSRVRRGRTRSRDGCDGRMTSGLSGDPID